MYHYGITIREFREKMKMTQQQLADRWPKSERFGGGEGVNSSYIQDIEHGRKRIDDPQTLRKVCDILHIPYWKVGFSEYDPFNNQIFPTTGKRLVDETLTMASLFLRQIWMLRHTAPGHLMEQSVIQLTDLFSSMQETLPAPIHLEEKFLSLYADVKCIVGVLAVDKKIYEKASQSYEEMYQIALQLNKPALIAHSLMNLGVESDREGKKKEAVDLLEQARDYSFEASKPWIVLIHSYLSRSYAAIGDATRFQRANDTARRLSSYLETDFTKDEDGVFYTLSNILAERSYGYLCINEPEKTLAMREEITRQIGIDNDLRLHVWIPLDWAKAYQMIGEIEKCIDELREFSRRCTSMGSPHASSKIDDVLIDLEDAGYGDVQAVKDFKEELVDK